MGLAINWEELTAPQLSASLWEFRLGHDDSEALASTALALSRFRRSVTAMSIMHLRAAAHPVVPLCLTLFVEATEVATPRLDLQAT